MMVTKEILYDPLPADLGRLIYKGFFQPDFIPLYDHPENRTKARCPLRQGFRRSIKLQDPETQLRPLREHAQHRGFVIAREFVDYASGRDNARSEYGKLLDAARRRDVDVVLVWRYDRFARSTHALINALTEFHALGVDFISLQEGTDTTTAQGNRRA